MSYIADNQQKNCQLITKMSNVNKLEKFVLDSAWCSCNLAITRF